MKINFPQVERSGLLGHWSGFARKMFTSQRLPALYGSLDGELLTGVGTQFSSNYVLSGALQGIRSMSVMLHLNTATQYICEFDTGIYLWANAGTLELKGYTGGYDIYVDGALTSTVSASTWHHVVVVLHATLDAAQVSFGRAGGVYFSGKACDFRLWTVAMSADMVAKLRAGGEGMSAPLKWPAMLLWWPLYNSDHTAAYVLDYSGRGNLGTAYGTFSTANKLGAPVNQYGLHVRAKTALFDGSDYASSSSIALGSIADAATASCWIVPTQVQRMHCFGWRDSAGHRMSVQVNNDGSVMCYVQNTSGTFGASTDAGIITAGKLYNITLTASASTVKVYINGSDMTTGTTSATSTSAGVWIGSHNGGGRFFYGLISRCAVWSRAMTSREVQGLVGGVQFEDYFSEQCVGAWWNKGLSDWPDATSKTSALTVSGSPPVYETFAAAKTQGAFMERMTYEDGSRRAITVLEDGYAEIPADATVYIQNVSVQFWVKMHALGKVQTLVSKSSAFVVQTDATDKIRFYVYTPTGTYVQSSTVLQLDTWYNICCTFDGSFKTIYINAVQDNLSGATGSITLNANPIRIGTFSSGSQLANASIGDVLLYGEAIPMWKVRKNYLAGKSIYL